MTIEHMPDGTKQYTSPEGVVTKHKDMSGALHYQRTGQRAPHDGATPAPTFEGQPASAEVRLGGNGNPDAIAEYKARCRAVGRARAQKYLRGDK